MTWSENVLGGIGLPRFLLTDNNYCSNRYFDEDTTGYAQSLGGIFSRVNTNAKAIGEYMGEITYANDYEYVDYTYNYGASITDKNFVAMVRIQSDSNFDIAFYGDSEFGKVNIDATPLHAINVVIYAKATGQAGNNIRLRIYGTQNAAQSALLYFDDLFFSEALDNMDMTQPTESGIVFEKITSGKNEMWNGAVQEFSQRWKPNYVAMWDYLEPQYEAYRQRIAVAQNIIVMPHLDVNWGMMGIWDIDFERRYWQKRFLGHKGKMVIKGINLITGFPVLQDTGEVLYIAEDEFIIT